MLGALSTRVPDILFRVSLKNLRLYMPAAVEDDSQ